MTNGPIIISQCIFQGEWRENWLILLVRRASISSPLKWGYHYPSKLPRRIKWNTRYKLPREVSGTNQMLNKYTRPALNGTKYHIETESLWHKPILTQYLLEVKTGNVVGDYFPLTRLMFQYGQQKQILKLPQQHKHDI